jgi:ABC-type uncharacterized transport system substrate-binding protein
MSRRVSFVALCALLFALCLSAEAQQPGKFPRIGFLSASGDPSSSSRNIEAFRQSLLSAGYVEGKNILIEYRNAGGNQDRIVSEVTELVQLNVDVLVLPTLRSIRAAKQATQTIPVVMLITDDPVATGIVESLARPGGNITGIGRLTRELSGKRLELLKELVPGMARVGVLWDASAGPESGSAIGFKEYEAAARALKVQLRSLEVRGPNPDLQGAFQAAAKGRVSAVITVRNPMLGGYSKDIADLAIRSRLPSMFETSQFVEAGGLVSYSSNDADLYRRAAHYVYKILKGAKPADLPIEQPTKFELVINLKTAKALDLAIPPQVLMDADKVIK